ncbi:MAG: Spy/CpxP family protein refolding chaperone [Opitutaceae bacterium]|jgi:Spy/CpxP family protein refolding chaperone
MKSSKLLLSVFALAVVSVAPALRAVDAPSTPAPAGAAERKGPLAERLKELADKLGLTDDQKAKLKPIIQDEAQAMKDLREDTSLDETARREKMMEIRKAHREQIAAILTPEQQAKLKDAREKRGPAPAGDRAAPRSEARGPKDGPMSMLTPEERQIMMEAHKQLQQDPEIVELNNQFKALNEKRDKLMADKLQKISPEVAAIFAKMKDQREKMAAERKAQMESKMKTKKETPAPAP